MTIWTVYTTGLSISNSYSNSIDKQVVKWFFIDHDILQLKGPSMTFHKRYFVMVIIKDPLHFYCFYIFKQWYRKYESRSKHKIIFNYIFIT